MTRPDTAVVIPARAASQRMEEKLLRADSGRALVTHTVDAAEAARAASDGRVAEVVVAVDDERIASAVAEYAASVGYATRVETTRADHRSGTDRIAEAVERLPESVDRIINIQGDEPELPPAEILRVGDLLDSHPDASMGTLVRPIFDEATFRDPNAVKAVLDHDGYCLYFSRAPVPHKRDGERSPGERFGYLHYGIYSYRRDFLLRYSDLPPAELETTERLEQLRALANGYRIAAAVTEYDRTGVDTEEDYRAFLARLDADA